VKTLGVKEADFSLIFLNFSVALKAGF